MKLLLLGAPGSGKGTISTILVQDQGFKHISTGNLFRDILEGESQLAAQIRNYLYKGELVPDSLTNEVLKNAIIDNIKNDANLVFDGYPRNVEQAKFLSHICEIDIVILLDVKEDVIIKRTLSRRICPTCGTIYNLENSVLKNQNLCNKDDSILIQRKDDNAETIKNRIKVYQDTSKELIEFYDKKKIVYRIDSNQEIDLVMQEISKIIKR